MSSVHSKPCQNAFRFRERREGGGEGRCARAAVLVMCGSGCIGVRRPGAARDGMPRQPAATATVAMTHLVAR